MSKIIGIGETLLDIVFNNSKPSHAVAGGSVFNAMVSLSRLGHETAMITEIGQDKVGDMILAFMEENGMTTKHIDHFTEGQSPISLAFLDQESNADYLFYKQYPHKRLRVLHPKIQHGDFFLFGSFYALNPEIRESVKEIIEYAKDRNALIYYDPNFRKTHAQDALKLMLFVAENMEYADIIRASIEDCINLFKTDDLDKIYKNHIAFYCPYFICTQAEKGVTLFTPQFKKHYPVPVIEPISTIGAGDNFNAGVIDMLARLAIVKEGVKQITENQWDKIIGNAIQFSQQVCRQNDNYISKEFAQSQKEQ